MHTSAQKPNAETDHDTTYYESFFEKNITGRFYFSQKYTALEIKRNSDTTPRLRYTPNTTLNMGIGATYRFFTLNLAYGFGFLNQGEERKGKTSYSDNQGHIYGRKLSIDLFAQFYQGYYLHPKGLGSADPNSYYIRPDMKFNLFGVAPYRILNDRKFSYRAAIIGNEWQKRSAGSFLLGGEIYYGHVKADSALVPNAMAQSYKQQGIHKIQFFEIGPGAGYAHTFVLGKHFFITGSLNANADLAWVRETNQYGSEDHLSISPNFLYRFATGYTSRSWHMNIAWVSSRITIRGASSADGYIGRVGNLRATFAKQFPMKKQRKK